MRNGTIIPPYLKHGDRVAVVAPSGRIDRETVIEAAALISGWGLEVEIGKNCLAVCNTFAGTDDDRVADLQKAVSDAGVKAIFCARGGYGMSRIIDRIDFSPLTWSPKWIVGYSDITVLHLWIGTRYGLATIHGEMLLNYCNDSRSERSVSSVRSLLFGERVFYEWQGEILRPQEATGTVTGGNLALLYSLAGTPGRPDTDGRILFIEDTGEYWYSVDRMLQSLRLSGLLGNLSALMVGDFSDMRDTPVSFGYGIREMVENATRGFGYPVFFGFPAGHCADNVAFFLGREARVSASGNYASMEYL